MKQKFKKADRKTTVEKKFKKLQSKKEVINKLCSKPKKDFNNVIQIAVDKTKSAHISEVETMFLTFRVPMLDEERKVTEIFIFTLLLGASKAMMKAFINLLRNQKEV